MSQDMCKVGGGDCGVMSKRRAAILSVVIEGRTQAETARQHKVPESTVSRWVTRYRAEGDTAFLAPVPPSPHRARGDLRRDGQLVVNLRSERTGQGLDAGATLAGTSNSATRSPCRPPRSAAASPNAV